MSLCRDGKIWTFRNETWLRSYYRVWYPRVKVIQMPACRCQLVVTICRLEGPRLRMQIPYSETIGFVKQRLAELLQEKHRNWKPDRMKLWNRGFYLEDNRTLSDYNLTSEDRIMLLLDDRCSLWCNKTLFVRFQNVRSCEITKVWRICAKSEFYGDS